MASRVLIVEDEPDIRDLLAHHLVREGYAVSTAANGVELPVAERSRMGQ